MPRGDEESPRPLSFAMGFLTLAFGSVRNDGKRDCTIATNHAARKVTPFRSGTQFADPSAYGGEERVMRINAVRCARALN